MRHKNKLHFVGSCYYNAYRTGNESTRVKSQQVFPSFAMPAFSWTGDEMHQAATGKQDKPIKIVIANAKGGCGKTTIATNIAAYLASSNKQTMMHDYDHQSSSIRWLENRDENLMPIQGVAAHQQPEKVTRAFQLRVPAGTEYLIVDTPGGINRFAFQEIIRDADIVIIPILPSRIDMDAASMFIEDTKRMSKRYHVRLAVVANRVRLNTSSFATLKEFLRTLEIPFIGSLRDTQNYVKASFKGIGVHELSAKSAEKDKQQWQPILNWLSSCCPNFSLPAEARVVNCA